MLVNSFTEGSKPYKKDIWDKFCDLSKDKSYYNNLTLVYMKSELKASIINAIDSFSKDDDGIYIIKSTFQTGCFVF